MHCELFGLFMEHHYTVRRGLALFSVWQRTSQRKIRAVPPSPVISCLRSEWIRDLTGSGRKCDDTRPEEMGRRKQIDQRGLQVAVGCKSTAARHNPM